MPRVICLILLFMPLVRGAVLTGAEGQRVAAASAATTSADSAVGTGMILGRVVDAVSGDPIGAAIVSISRADLRTETPRCLVGPDGRFLFHGLPKGRYSINVSKDGYLDGAFGRRRPNGQSQQLELSDGERRQDVAVPMWRYAAIEGVVVDESSEPVANAKVRAYLRTSVGGGPRWRPVGSATATDDRGTYRIWNLRPGDYIVGIEMTTVALPVSAVTGAYQGASGPDDSTRAALARELMIATGGAFGATGIHIDGLVQNVGPSPTPPQARPHAPLLVYPTAFHPAAASPSSATVIALRAGDERTDVDIQMTLARGVRVSGLLTAPDRAVPNLAVRLAPAGSDAATWSMDMTTAATVSDADGAFTLLGVPPGDYVIRAVSPTLWTSLPISVAGQDIGGVILSLKTAVRVAGRVELDALAVRPPTEQLRRMFILLDPLAPSMAMGVTAMDTGRVETDGRFTATARGGGQYVVRIGGVPPGWTVRSITLEEKEFIDRPLVLGDTDVTELRITLTDRSNELSGRVLDDRGHGDAGATVLVFPAEWSVWRDGGPNPRTRSVRTTSAGGYSVAGLPPGDYHVVAVPDELVSDSWSESNSLDALTRSAATVRIEYGLKLVRDLRTLRTAR